MEPMFRATRPLSSSNRHQRRASAKRSRGKDTKHRLTKAQQDAINKAADRFAACGCDCCGAPATPGFPAFCVPHGAEFLAICRDCEVRQNMKPTVAVIPDALIDPWAEDDRDWFAVNPNRSLRLRKTHPGELQAAAIECGAPTPIQMPGHTWVTVTYQINPGERARFFRQVSHDTTIDCLTDREIATGFLFEGSPEAAEEGFDDVMARPRGWLRADALIRRMQSRLSRFEEDAP
jgi:hypothetical protein